MEDVIAIWNFLQSPTAVAIFAALWALSEALASIPAIRANSVFQLLRNILAKFAKKEEPKP